MNYITLIKTAQEMPSGSTLITSIVEKEYEDIEELLDLLTKYLYVFVVHGKDHKIDVLETSFASNSAVFTFLSDVGHTFKRPLNDNFYDCAGSSLAKFIYECGYVDCWTNNPPRVNKDSTKE